MNDPLPKLLITVGEMVELTGWSSSYCYELVASGVIPSLRQKRSIRIPYQWLVHWIDERMKEQGWPSLSEGGREYELASAATKEEAPFRPGKSASGADTRHSLRG